MMLLCVKIALNVEETKQKKKANLVQASVVAGQQKRSSHSALSRFFRFTSLH